MNLNRIAIFCLNRCLLLIFYFPLIGEDGIGRKGE